MSGFRGHSESEKENGDHSDELVLLIISIGSKGHLRSDVQLIPFGRSNWGS